MVVRLPEPSAGRHPSFERILEVRSSPEVGSTVRTESLRLTAELLATREELLEWQAANERTEEEFKRALADLEAVRKRQADDAQRFRDGLARLQAAADEVVAGERRATVETLDRLAAAQDELEANAAAIDELRREVEQTTAARGRADRERAAEIDGLRDRIGELEGAEAEARRLSAELQQAARHVDEVQAERDQALSTASEARAAAEAVRARLTMVREALDDE